MKISTILDKIDENQLRVPAFQREYVWKRDDVKQLVDSLVKDYPTGTLLTWDTNHPPELKGDEKYSESQGAIKILLDGQQRVTTLYLLARGKTPPYYSPEEITSDITGLYINLETRELAYYQKIRMEGDPRWRDVSDILQKKIRSLDVVNDLQAQGTDTSNGLYEVIDDNFQSVLKILDRDFPEQTVPIHASVQEAIEIFYKVNAGGVALTAPELALAQISGYWPEAREEFKAKLEELAEHGFVFKLDFIIFVMLGCMYHRGSEFKRLHSPEDNADRIRGVWEKLRDETLDYVCNILKSRAYVDHSWELAGPYSLIPMIVYCFEHAGDPSDLEIRKMIKWFYYSQLRGRYVNQTRTLLDHDLKILESDESPFDRLLGVIEENSRLEVRADEFVFRGVQHPLFRMMHWLFKSRGAVCLTTGVGLQVNMGSKYTLERDHIFPYSELKKIGYGQDDGHKYMLAQEMTNRAILTQVANRSKASTLPSTYLAKAQEQFPGSLELQCIPTDPSLWEINRYEDFLQERRAQFATAMNEFLEGITETTAVAGPVRLEDRVDAGESVELEFKSSMRWDVKRGEKNKGLEINIAKAVAALANADGGTLLVGVDDDGNALGMENDYAAVEGDKDVYEQKLRSLLHSHFDVSEVAKHVSISFPELRGIEICQIDVGRPSKPWFVRLSKGGDGGAESLYVRNGNRSDPIPPSQIASYVKDRFG